MTASVRARVVVVGAVLVAAAALLVVLEASVNVGYALAAWPSSPRYSAIASWATAGLAVIAAALSDVTPPIRLAIVLAALLGLIEEADALGGVAPWAAASGTVAGALLPPSLGAVIVAIALTVAKKPAPAAWGLLLCGAAAGVAAAIVIDPRRHGCARCVERPWGSIELPGMSAALSATAVGLTVGAAVLGTILAARSWRHSGTAVWPWVALLGGWTSLAVVALSRARGALETPSGAARAVVFGGLLVIAAAALWPRLSSARRRARLVRTVARIASGAGPTDVDSALGKSLADPTLRVAYAVTDHDLVDAAGMPVPAEGAHRTAVERGEDRVVLLTRHRQVDPHRAELAVALAWPILAVQLESARLSIAAHLLAAARHASLERADREAGLLRRDLHDGAQQRLVSLMIGIRVAADRAGGSLELESARADVQSALDEVRRISHGDLPITLDEQGLATALHDLAHEFPGTSITVDGGCDSLPSAVRNTVYLIAAACLPRKDIGPSPSTIRVRWVGDSIRITAETSVPAADSSAVEIAVARVRTLGGSWITHDRRIEVDLPCA